jgi:4-amino-4-deoxy-L-arabinose transferase-like glycosyltransferase
MQSFKKISFYNKLFVALLTFQLVLYAIFRHLYTAPQTFDSAGHMALAFKFAHLFGDFLRGGETTLYDILTTSFYYPPLMHWVGGLLTLVFGKSFDLMLYLVFFTFLGCLFLIRKIVLELGFGEKVAFYSAFFYSIFPFTVDQSRLFHTDIPMTLFLLLCVHFLIRSGGFRSTKYTLLFFVSAGFGMLIRWFVPFFLAIPVLYILYLSLYRDRTFKAVVPKILIGLGLFLAISLPWYIANLELLRVVSAFFSQGEKDDPQVFLSLENLGFYLKNIGGFQILFVPFVLSIVALFKLRKADRKTAVLVFAEILVIYAFFTVVKNKNSRYVLGLLPVFGFLTAYGFSLVSKKAIKIIVLGLCLAGLFYTSFNRASVRSVESGAWGILLAGPFYDNLYVYPFVFTYRTSQIDVQKLVTDIAFQAGNAKIKPIGIASSVDSEAVSAANLELARIYLNYDDMFFATPYFRERPFGSYYELVKYLRDRGVSFLLDADYAGPDNHRHYKVLVQLGEFARSEGAYWFDKTSIYDYSGNEIRVLRRKDFNTDFPVDTCRVFSTTEGSLSLMADPLASMVLFTASFEYAGVKRAYEPQSTRILEIDNFDSVPRSLTVSNLPAQVSVCHRMGTQIKLIKEISQAVISDASKCGQSICTSLIHSRWGINNVLEEKRYSKEDFEGRGLAKLLKSVKLYPYYREFYSVKKDIMDELNPHGAK